MAGVVELFGRCAHHHAKERFGPTPVDRRVAHGDSVSPCLYAGRNAVAGRGRKIFERAIGVTHPQIAATANRINAPQMVTKGRANRCKIGDNRYLGNKENRVGQGERLLGRSGLERNATVQAREQQANHTTEQRGAQRDETVYHVMLPLFSWRYFYG